MIETNSCQNQKQQQMIEEEQKIQKKQTCIIYDPTTQNHFNEKEHVENPSRISSILQHLEQKQLLNSQQILKIDKIEPIKEYIISLVHPENYIDLVKSLHDPESKKQTTYLKSTYINQSTFQCSLISAGGVCEAARLVQTGAVNNAFAVVRPPGHHAGEQTIPHGFCFFNNVSIATKVLQKEFSQKKILILDWDIHHGDGTQKIFYDDPSVLYISMHRYDKGTFFPRTGAANELGLGSGIGFNINIPFNTNLTENKITIGNPELIYTYQRIIYPIIKQFQPDFVFISAGFDCAQGDPLGQGDATNDSYCYMLEKTMEICPKIVVCLEGGYNIQQLQLCSEGVVRTLLGQKMPIQELLQSYSQSYNKWIPNFIAINAVEECLPILEPYWPCLFFQENLDYQKNMQFLIKQYSSLSGGHMTNVIIEEKIYFKEAKKNEILFYEQLDNTENEYYQQNQILKKFAPGFYGSELVKDKKYIKMENQLHNKTNGSIIDIKFGQRTFWDNAKEDKIKKQTQKALKTTSFNLYFRVVGVVLKDKQGNVVERIDPANCQIVTEENFSDYLIKFLKSNQEKAVRPEILNNLVEFLKDFYEFYKTINTRRFVGISLLGINDNLSKKFSFKIIDFNYYGPKLQDDIQDNNILKGIENLLNICIQIRNKLSEEQQLQLIN